MPTLFTALQSHLAGRERKRRSIAPALPGVGALAKTVGPLGATAAIEALKAAQQKRARKKPENPRPKLSLLQRFDPVQRSSTPPHIIVVGAGFAGLSAAYELQSVGYKVTVLEAQDDVGGRVKSTRHIVPGRVMERGAELIGKNHLAWWSYKRIFGLKFEELRDYKYPSPVILGGYLLSPARAEQMAHEMARGTRLVNNRARKVKAYEPWETTGARRLDNLTLVQGLRRLHIAPLGELAILEQLQSDNGVEASKQSWLGNLAMIKGGGLRRYWTDTETHHCKGGNQRLAHKFKAALHTVDTGKVVTKIEIRKNGVTVELSRGKPVIGDDVILAVPPTMWWKHIKFSPNLPRKYRVHFGNNVKFLLNVDQQAWAPESPEMSSDGPVDMTWQGSDRRDGSRAGFVAFSGAASALTCSRWKNRKKKYLDRLSPIYARIKRGCDGSKFENWPKFKWTRGSYSFPLRGEVMRVGQLMRDGFKGRLHFAGEHTCYAFTGYMEGALRSGLRVAEQIARRDRMIRRKKKPKRPHSTK
jgi:monoamine oxidase